MAPRYQLFYWQAQGLAENIRLLFVQAGVQYEDIRFEEPRRENPEWLKLKPETPFGVLPHFKQDGVDIVESWAIIRHVAREVGLYGTTGLESGRIESLVEVIRDVFTMGMTLRFNPNPEARAATSQQFVEKIPSIIRYLESVLTENKASGWLVGNQVSVADIVLYHAYAYCGEHQKRQEFDYLRRSECLMKHHQKVANLPRIKEWIEKRPNTEN